jgi:thiol-disulfide isomerase/thioredoxin
MLELRRTEDIVALFFSGFFLIWGLGFVNNDFKLSAKKEKQVILYFGAEWCPPCKAMKKMMKDTEVKKELQKFDLQMIDIDKNPAMAKKYNIKSIPTTIFPSKNKRYVGGKTKSQFLAILSKESS